MKAKVIVLIAMAGLITALLGLYSDAMMEGTRGYPLVHRLLELQTSTHSSPVGAAPAEEEDLDAKPIDYLYVTVLGHDPEYHYSFQEIQKLPQEQSQQEDPRLPVYVALANDPGIGNDADADADAESNGTIAIRGNSARRADLQSFKIRLQDGTELWRNQDVINLNKHPYDKVHVRNKLSYDLFELIPDIPHLDTQFVRLYVRDLTDPTHSNQYVDYGLFTHVEQVNRTYLEKNFLDPDGYLYKAINFEFYRYPDKLRNRDDPRYDRGQFETILQIDGREYHDRLLTLLDDLNNDRLDITKVVHRYFDKDNLLTWLGINMLTGNLDTSSNNFFLYSPLLSDQWFFIPWDYDGAWNYHYSWGRNGKTVHPFREGITLYSGWPWLKRYLAVPDNLSALNAKIEELASIITEEQIRDYLDEYYPTVRPLMMQEPNVQLITPDEARFDEEYYALAAVPKQKLDLYYKNLEKPMPIFLGSWSGEDKVTLSWTASIDLQGDPVFYDILISEDPGRTRIVREIEGVQETQTVIEGLPEGEYYWTVVIRDGEGNEQVPFETFNSEDRTPHHGVRQLIIE